MAKFKINDKQWNALSKEDQKKVTQLLKRVGSLQEGDQIVGDAAAPELPAGDAWPDWPKIPDFGCQFKCEVAGRAAQAACALLTGPAMGICMAAAELALDECKRRC